MGFLIDTKASEYIGNSSIICDNKVSEGQCAIVEADYFVICFAGR